MNELIDFRIKELENDVKALWDKWDGMQRLILGMFVTLAFNLVGIIALLAKNYIK